MAERFCVRLLRSSMGESPTRTAKVAISAAPPIAHAKAADVAKLNAKCVRPIVIARQLDIVRASVYRIIAGEA